MLHAPPATQTGEDRMLARMREAGLVDGARTGTQSSIFGPLAFYQAAAPIRRSKFVRKRRTKSPETVSTRGGY